MLRSVGRFSFSVCFRVSFGVVVALAFSANGLAQTSQKPLRSSEVVALEAGGALQANVVHEVSVRGLSFHPDEDYRAVLKKAGADATVLDAVAHAKVVPEAGKEKLDKALLEQLAMLRRL
jgi:hypothetical protein